MVFFLMRILFNLVRKYITIIGHHICSAEFVSLLIFVIIMGGMWSTFGRNWVGKQLPCTCLYAELRLVTRGEYGQYFYILSELQFDSTTISIVWCFCLTRTQNDLYIEVVVVALLVFVETREIRRGGLITQINNKHQTANDPKSNSFTSEKKHIFGIPTSDEDTINM